MSGLQNPIIRASIEESINTYGFHIMGIFNGRPPFGYTIGLTDRLGYELIVVGVGNEGAGMIINTTYVEWLTNGKDPGLNNPFNPFGTIPFKIVEAEYELVADKAVQAFLYYSRKVPYRQIVMSDKNGKFPEDPDYDHAYMDSRQTLLYRTH